MSEDEGAWIIVGRRNERRPSQGFSCISACSPVCAGPAPSPPSLYPPPRSIKALTRARAEVSQLAQALHERLLLFQGEHSFSRFLLLGIGTPASSAPARYQLALALELREFLSLELHVHDPALCADDVALLLHEHCKLLDGSQASQFYSCDEAEVRLISYMPHCAKELYDNVLAANWNTSSLQRLVLIGNSFSAYADKGHTSLVALASAFATEYALLRLCSNSKTWPVGSFNDTATIHFDARRMGSLEFFT